MTGTPPALGAYQVTAVADDLHGGISSTTLTLNVSNNLPPVCAAAAASPGALWPPNHKFVPISINNVTDPDGDALTIKVTRILQDEPTIPAGHYEGDSCNGHHHVDHDDWDDWGDWGSGNTSTDGLIAPRPSVRAERAGQGDGRIYEIRFTATDPQGAACSGAVFTGVPHDQGPSHPPVDSDVRYDSLVPGGLPLGGPDFNKAPKLTNPGSQTTGVQTAVNLRTMATDVNLDTLSYSAAGLPPGLTIKSTTGVISGSPTTPGAYTVTLAASDPFGGIGTATFTWTILANRPPVTVVDLATLSKGASTTLSVLSNDSDPDGDPLALVSVQGAHGGTATKSGSTVVYKASSSFIGIDQFTYSVSDGRGGTATGTIRIEVASHKDGDRCDHDRRRSGHYAGDGCEHDRVDRSQH
jgi:hypothetical protein